MEEGPAGPLFLWAGQAAGGGWRCECGDARNSIFSKTGAVEMNKTKNGMKRRVFMPFLMK